MFSNYLKLAFRNLTRQKAFSFINITGLAVGLASGLVILLWIQDELSFDRFHAGADRTYRLLAKASNLEVAISPAPVAPALEEIIPEISQTTRIANAGGVMIQAGDEKFEEEEAFFAEPSVFLVFDFNLLQGDPVTALTQPNSVILSEDLAMKYFGTVDVIGKTVLKDGKDEMLVTGLLAKPDGNSHLQFSLLMPWSYLATRDHNIKNNEWGNFDFYTYIQFDKPIDDHFRETVEQRTLELFKSHETRVEVEFTLQPITGIHLRSGLMADVKGHGNAQYVSAFSLIAVFVVLLGCINFMNLSTARATRRAREVGLRKVVGAVRWQLIRQFLGESLAVTFIALVIAVMLVFACLPVVNGLVGKMLVIDLTDPLTIGALVCVALVTGIASGVYPAFVLSAFAPVKVLKNDVRGGSGGIKLRNVLVVAQFVISIVLLAGTSVVYQQLNYIRSKDLGFDKENLLYMQVHGDDMSKKIPRWRAALEANPLTSNVSTASGVPTNHVSGVADVKWQGKDPDTQIMFACIFVDENFVPVYNMEMVSGRNFLHEMRGDTSNFIINETAARIMGFTEESAVGQTLEQWDDKGTIVGVVKDFNFKPLQSAIEPLIMRPNTWGRTVVVRAEAGKTAETIKAMEEVWSSLENVYPFSYQFVDQDLDNLYKGEKQIGTLFTVFAALAIIISCLGLYGLSAYVAEQRMKEIGIRKSLGASVPHIIYLLNTRFIVPVIVAMIISAPLAYVVMSQWLQGFAYKIGFNWGVVFTAGAAALLISILTVSFETTRAAKANPVKSLRME